ncbi:MAG TPA: nucleotidyltransferase domain-containing protein [Candidatus Acidoferrum sp.]|nr:nucleotidyltransferase domain-containing protein [Candidatus Acidoferrum sp.]
MKIEAEMLSTDAKLTELVKRLKEFAATNLECVILFGSAARGDFREGHSDLNVVCILRSLTVEELGRLAGVVKWWCVDQKEPAPLFFTHGELREAADVFAIEISDMKQGRRVLYGEDLVAGIEVPMNLHRLQIERDLRTMLLKLRQHYLRAPGNAHELAPVLGKSFSGVLTLLRHTVIVFGEAPPVHAKEIVARAAALTGADPTAFEALLKLRESGEFHGDIVSVYGTYLKALEKVLHALDHHFPKREWQRVKKTGN